jgi:hypothetical protein
MEILIFAVARAAAIGAREAPSRRWSPRRTGLVGEVRIGAPARGHMRFMIKEKGGVYACCEKY